MSVPSAPIFVPSALRYLHSWNASEKKGKKIVFLPLPKKRFVFVAEKSFFLPALNSRLFLFCLFFQLTTSVDRRFLPYLSFLVVVCG